MPQQCVQYPDKVIIVQLGSANQLMSVHRFLFSQVKRKHRFIPLNTISLDGEIFGVFKN